MTEPIDKMNVSKKDSNMLSLEEKFPDQIATPHEITNLKDLLAGWRSIRSVLLEILNTINDIDFTQPSASGGWNAGQNAEHLFKTQYSLARMIPSVMQGKSSVDRDQLKKLPYQSLFRRASEPGKAKNPDIVSPDEPNQKWTKTYSIERLGHSMNRLEDAVQNSATSIIELLADGAPHPIFGPISLADWTYVLSAHEIAHGKSLARKYNV